MDQGDTVERMAAAFSIDDEDEEGLIFDNVAVDSSEIDDRWLLVGTFLTNRAIDFQAMQNKIATLWQPGRGLYVKELEPNLFLFQFYHEVDIERVIEGSPWTFDRAPLIFERVKQGENPRQVVLSHLELWVQIHNMVTGFMSERIIQGIGNYIGSFVKSDPNNFLGVWRDYLRIRVKIRVDKPLKKKKKLEIQGGPWLKSGLAMKTGIPAARAFTSNSSGDGSSQGTRGADHHQIPIARNPGDSLLPNNHANFDKNLYGELRGARHLGKEKSLEIRELNGEESELAPGENNSNEGLTFIDNKRRRMGLVDGSGLVNEEEIEVTNKAHEDIIFTEMDVVCDSGKVAVGSSGVFSVDSIGLSGGVAFLWKNKDDGMLLGYNKNHIDLVIHSTQFGNWRLTGVYGEPIRSRRHETWALLRTLARQSDLPWCVIGDVNNVVRQEDKRGGRPYPQGLITGFNTALQQCDLVDIEIHGHPFTWEKGRGSNNWVEVRLDRALASSTWHQIFPTASLTNLDYSTSDHTPIFLEPKPQINVTPIRRFRFENSWLKEPLCVEIVRDCWEEGHDRSFSEKLLLCAEKLSSWGKEITGTLNHRIKRLKADLKRLNHGRDEASIQNYKAAKENLFKALDQRECYWKQRAKQFWLKEGDQNSNYFHKAASTRKSNNLISTLRDEHGNWVTWENGLPQVVANYFNVLFTSSNTSCQEIIDYVPNVVPDWMNLELGQPIVEEEVKKAVFQMHPDKSPGPDGMTPAFYQKCWPIVKHDVIHCVRKFFEQGIFDNGCGNANVVLIPKKKNPEVMADLRPIALCNVLYKIITKVMVNRMKPFMDVVVSENQSAFIPGRLISDNVLVSFEILHYLKRKRRGKEGYMALKLDMSKAYDRVEWGFLEAMLRKMGFMENWVQLLMRCVKSASYKFVHGNFEVGPIVPSRGIRQGDPLSPYLFILCAEGLTALLRKYEQRGLIHGCKVANGAPRISHMLFADDSYLYCKANEVEARRIKEILYKFELASGQKVNFAKSSIFFSSNVEDNLRNVLCTSLAMGIAPAGSLYLGLPSSMSRNKTAALGYLKERIRKKLQGWSAKFISRAGKEVLIKAVAQSLPSYAMNVFMIPTKITTEMESLMARYWWKSSASSNSGIHWMSWKRLCHHKTKGGMGFRNLRDFNMALLGKQGWRLCVNTNSLVARIFKARYYPNGSFLTASLGSNPSYVWRSILEAQKLVVSGVRWTVGNGRNIRVLGEPWLPDNVNPMVISTHPSLSNAKVENLLSIDGREWDIEILNDLFEPRDRELILKIPLQPSSTMDCLTWSLENSGLYTVRSAYNQLQILNGVAEIEETVVSKFWKLFWCLKVPPKMKNLVWRACMDCLPTTVQLRSKHVEVSTLCPVCSSAEETIFHALVECPTAAICWERTGIGTVLHQNFNFLVWCMEAFQQVDKSGKETVVAVCWALWNARNDKVWQGKSVGADGIVSSAKNFLNHWQNAQKTVIETTFSGLIPGDAAEHWFAPIDGRVKVNVDAALFSNPHHVGIGLVARDSRGFLIEGCTKTFQGNFPPATAEAMGIREALSWIKTRQWTNVDIESDCLTVIQALRSPIEMISMFGQIVKASKDMLKDSNNVFIYFVRRSS
uniref:Reverse transcriptase domain-containing protein n=1 Tax=Cannabis sativa TaxID=3483 RepID=A0A803NFH1_CANSA